ncbi:MAG: hypothetical protein C4581_03595 [Nitrospiraceae bacterium]|nr:MAG: hypothetical protein C4581_03595 [Nitrospiraceae bacterium]
MRGVVVEQIDGVRIGKVIDVDDNGRVFIDFAGNPHGLVSARHTSSVNLDALCKAASSGQDVLLVFENSDPLRPIIIDTISSCNTGTARKEDINLKVDELSDIKIDGKKMTFDAGEQIVLKCGKASITLTKAGKVIIRGAYLLSRSSGVNRIKGGSVQIN